MDQTGDEPQVVFDDEVDRAWRQLEAALADRIAALGPDEIVSVAALEAVELEGASPYVQLCAWRGPASGRSGRSGQASLVVRLEAVSNTYLDASRRLDDDGCAELAALGFTEPDEPDDRDDSADGRGEGEPNWFVDRVVDDPDDHAVAEELAAMAVRALRDAYGVLAPALLDAGGLMPDVPLEAVVTSPPSPPPVVVQSHDDLGDHLARALVPVLGHVAERDADGDVPIDTQHGRLWIVVPHDGPYLDVFGTVLSGVDGRAAVLDEVNRLNVGDALVQFVVVDDRVLAHLRLDCAPFCAEVVARQVAHVVTSYDAAVERMRTVTAAGDERERRRLAARTLAELVAAERSEGWRDRLDAAVVAAVCEHDRRLVLEVLRGTQAQLRRYRGAIAKASEPRRSDLLRERLLRRQRALLREALLLTARDA